jgi:aminomethyltransferase
MVEFGGWEMPLSYPSGTIAEHMACRCGAVVFDVSHLGTVRVQGSAALGTLQSTLTNDLAKIGPGRAQYSHLLDPDASVVDDLIVWWVSPERFDVMPNASNTARVLEALGGADVTAGRAVLAIQGPTARRVLRAVSADAASVARFAVSEFSWRSGRCLAAGTGYTGEDGVECAVPAELAEPFFEAVVGAGALPAGLGARDTLRLEAGFPLHGHELGPGITPLQAGLGWVVAWNKPSGFRGREALAVERNRGVSRTLMGLVAEGRQPPRPGGSVSIEGKVAGEVTSGNWSPVLGHGIAMAFLPPSTGAGEEAEIEVRKHELHATVTTLPFVPRGKAA